MTMLLTGALHVLDIGVLSCCEGRLVDTDAQKSGDDTFVKLVISCFEHVQPPWLYVLCLIL